MWTSTRHLLLGLALLGAVALGCSPAGRSQPRTPPAPRDNPSFVQQTQLYALYRTEHAELVMLGDSITYAVNWNELLGRSEVVNRGIPSDTLEGFLLRLDDVYKLHPRLCVVMGGINDIYDGVPVETIFERYQALIARLREHGITPVIESTLLVSPRWRNADEKNPLVMELDARLAAYAARERLDFVDLNPTLSAGGRLREDVTLDGVHLTATGYRLWREALEPVLRGHGL